MQEVKYKGDTPAYNSNFLEDIYEPKDNYTVTFLGNYMEPSINSEKKVLVDLYFVQYNNGRINTVFQFGEHAGDYASGESQAYSSLAMGKVNGYTEVYGRAVKEGLIQEQTKLVGYSEILEEERSEEYYNSAYYTNKPGSILEMEIPDDISDEEYDRIDAERDKLRDDYDIAYEKEHGSIPQSPIEDKYHIFESLEDARKYCSQGKGVFKKVTFSSDSHLEMIARHEDFYRQILLNRQANSKMTNDAEASM